MGIIIFLFTGKGRERLTSFPGVFLSLFYAQSETDPFPSFSGLPPSFSAVSWEGEGCLVASGTEPRFRCHFMPFQEETGPEGAGPV